MRRRQSIHKVVNLLVRLSNDHDRFAGVRKPLGQLDDER
jgi:hypothetical protein